MKANRPIYCVLALMFIAIGCRKKEDAIPEALSKAARADDIKRVRSLLSRGVDVDPASADAWGALHDAAVTGHTDVAKLLIENGADVNVVDTCGRTPLLCAFRSTGESAVEYLIAKGANIEAITQPRRYFMRPATFYHEPLRDASKHGYRNLVELLIEKGADVDARDQNRITALHEAAAHGFVDIVELLIAHGADIRRKTPFGWPPPQPLPASVGPDKYIPLIVAEDAASVFTPLHYALVAGHKGVVGLLEAEGAKVNTTIKYRDDWTLLHAVARHGRKNGAELLLARGADVNATTRNGRTPIDIAYSMGYRDIVRFLNSAGGEFGVSKNVGKGWLE